MSACDGACTRVFEKCGCVFDCLFGWLSRNYWLMGSSNEKRMNTEEIATHLTLHPNNNITNANQKSNEATPKSNQTMPKTKSNPIERKRKSTELTTQDLYKPWVGGEEAFVRKFVSIRSECVCLGIRKERIPLSGVYCKQSEQYQTIYSI